MFEKIKEYNKLKIKYPLSEVERLLEIAQEFMKLSPIQKGDTVQLKDFEINVKDSPGWFRHRHILKKGLKAQVEDIYWFSGKYYAKIPVFVHTWISEENEIFPKDKPITKIFTFSIEHLEKLNKEE